MLKQIFEKEIGKDIMPWFSQILVSLHTHTISVKGKQFPQVSLVSLYIYDVQKNTM